MYIKIVQKNTVAVPGGVGNFSSFYILLLNLAVYSIFLMNHKSETKQQISLTPDLYFVGIPLITCCLTLIYLFRLLPDQSFLLCFKNQFLIYNFSIINCIHLTCSVSWVVTSVHTCEILQSGYRTFRHLYKILCCPCCSPFLPGHRQSLHILCPYGSPSSRSSCKCNPNVAFCT